MACQIKCAYLLQIYDPRVFYFFRFHLDEQEINLKFSLPPRRWIRLPGEAIIAKTEISPTTLLNRKRYHFLGKCNLNLQIINLFRREQKGSRAFQMWKLLFNLKSVPTSIKSHLNNRNSSHQFNIMSVLLHTPPPNKKEKRKEKKKGQSFPSDYGKEHPKPSENSL